MIMPRLLVLLLDSEGKCSMITCSHPDFAYVCHITKRIVLIVIWHITFHDFAHRPKTTNETNYRSTSEKDICKRKKE